MKYTVRYRGEDGAGELEVEAGSRAGVFEELKRRGFRGTVLGISEGGAAKGGGGATRARLAKAGVVLAVLALTAGSLIWWRGRRPAPVAPDGPTVRPASPVRPSSPSSPAGPSSPTSAKDATERVPPGGVSAATAEKPTRPSPEGEGVPPGHIKLPTGQVLKYKLPPEGKTRKLIANGEVFEVYPDGFVTNISPRPLFQKPFERTLAVLAYPDDGILMMEDVAKMSREDVLKWCREPTGYYDDDTEEDLGKRKTVAEMKAAVLEYLEGGGEFSEYVEAVRNFNREELAFHTAGLHEITTAIREGRLADARAYLKGIGEAAQANGYRPLSLPRRYRDLLEAAP